MGLPPVKEMTMDGSAFRNIGKVIVTMIVLALVAGLLIGVGVGVLVMMLK